MSKKSVLRLVFLTLTLAFVISEQGLTTEPPSNPSPTNNTDRHLLFEQTHFLDQIQKFERSSQSPNRKPNQKLPAGIMSVIKNAVTVDYNKSSEQTVSAPLPFILTELDEIPFRTLTYLQENEIFDFNQRHTFTFVGPNGLPYQLEISLARHLVQIAANPNHVSLENLQPLLKLIEGCIQRGFSLFEAPEQWQSSIVTLMEARQISRRIAQNPRAPEEFRGEQQPWSQRAFDLLNHFIQMRWWDLNRPLVYNTQNGPVLVPPVALALQFGDLDLALNFAKMGGDLNRVRGDLLESSLFGALASRHVGWVNQILSDEKVRQVVLNRPFQSGIYSGLLPINATIFSVLRDGNLPATISWIQQLVSRGLDLSFNALDPRPLSERLIGEVSNDTLSEFGIPAPEYSQYRYLLGQLADYLDSDEFKAFVRNVENDLIEAPFEPVRPCQSWLQ